MQQNTSSSVDGLPPDLQRAETSLAALSERIARLSLSLGAPLSSWQDFEHILERDMPFFAEHAAFVAAGWANSAQLREAREWEELRGLLMVRCELMLALLKTHTLEDALEVSAAVEAQLLREGFKPGSDGPNLLAYLAQHTDTARAKLDPPQAD